MSDDDLMVDGRPLSSLKVAELKEELDKRQISIKGVKSVLQDRLREALSAQDDATVETPVLEQVEGRTESEASGTNTPQNNLSPSKKTETSPSKRQTPKRGQKPVQSKQNEESVETPEVEKESVPSDECGKVESKTVDEKDNGISEQPSAEKSGEKITDKDEINVPVIEKLNEPIVTPTLQDIKTLNGESEVNEKSKSSRENVKETVQEEQIQPEKEVQKEDDGDELDYGDEEEKEQKDDESMDSDDVKVEKEKLVQVEQKQDKKNEGVKKEEKVRASVSHRRVSSPSSRHPVSNIVHIRGLTRPFTERQLRNEIEKHGGEIADFWIDKVKSHCFVKLNTDADAGKVLDAMHNTVWPDGNPKKLAIVFETEDNMTRYKEGRESGIVEAGTIGGRADRLSTTSQTSMIGGKASFQITLQNAVRENDKLDSERKEKRGNLASRLTRIDDKEKPREDRKRKRSETPPFSRGAGFMDEKKAKHEEVERGSRREEPGREANRRDERRAMVEEVPKKSLDQIFKKTVAVPMIYYLPLTDEQIAEKASKKKEKESDRIPERVERSDRGDADRSRGERSDRGDRDRSRGERNDRGDRGERPRRRD